MFKYSTHLASKRKRRAKGTAWIPRYTEEYDGTPPIAYLLMDNSTTSMSNTENIR